MCNGLGTAWVPTTTAPSFDDRHCLINHAIIATPHKTLPLGYTLCISVGYQPFVLAFVPVFVLAFVDAQSPEESKAFPIVLTQEDSSLDQAELIQESSLTPEQIGGKRAMEERCRFAA